MKALIVTNNEAKPIAGALQKVLELVNVSAAICGHGNALNEFLETEPDACIILNYGDEAKGAGSLGKKTYEIIKAAAEPHQMIIGPQAYFEPLELYRLLGLDKKEE